MMPKYRIKETDIISSKFNSKGKLEKYNKTVYEIYKFNFWFLSYDRIDYIDYSTFDDALFAIAENARLIENKKKDKNYYFDYLQFKLNEKL